MKKSSVLALFVVSSVPFAVLGLGPWIVHINNLTPMPLQVTHKYIYPDFGGIFKEQVVDTRVVPRGQKLALNQDQISNSSFGQNYRYSIGSVIELQAPCGLGGSPYSKTNKIVIARPFVFSQLQSVPRFTKNKLEELIEREGLDKNNLSVNDLVSMQEKLFRSAFEQQDTILIPMVPSGSYQVTWDKNAPCNRSLRITQKYQVNPAMDIYFR